MGLPWAFSAATSSSTNSAVVRMRYSVAAGFCSCAKASQATSTVVRIGAFTGHCFIGLTPHLQYDPYTNQSKREPVIIGNRKPARIFVLLREVTVSGIPALTGRGYF